MRWSRTALPLGLFRLVLAAAVASGAAAGTLQASPEENAAPTAPGFSREAGLVGEAETFLFVKRHMCKERPLRMF